MRDDGDLVDLLASALLVLIPIFMVGLVLCGGLATVARLRASSRCLALGYPREELDWQFRAYCVRRVDQTDVVVPLAEAERGR